MGIQQCDIVVTIKIHYKKILLKTPLIKNWSTLTYIDPFRSTMKDIFFSFQVWKSIGIIVEMECTKKITLFT
jgi:hypothetical protein